MPKRRQLGGRADGAGHEARLVFGGKLLRDFFGDPGGGDVDFGNFVLQIVLGQHHAGAAEGVSLDHVAAHLEEVGVNVLDDVGPAQNQQFVAALLTPEIVHTGIAELDIRPHGAVVDDDAVASRFGESQTLVPGRQSWSVVQEDSFSGCQLLG